ncbi:MAG: hypothetical protein AAF098_01440 [Pseudomonadota bacterium]
MRKPLPKVSKHSSFQRLAPFADLPHSVLLFCVLAVVSSQLAAAEISSIDLVRVKNGNLEEALFYYEHNWLVYRQRALERGLISGFDLLLDDQHESGPLLMLLTKYKDKKQFEQREENFATVMPADRQPLLANEKLPADFREIISYGDFVRP